MPETVQAVLAARLDRLPPEAKALLQVAAVIGTEVPGSLLQVVTACSEATLRQHLAHLQGAELLYAARPVPEPVYAFQHALTQEVAYHSCYAARGNSITSRLPRCWGDCFPSWRPNPNCWRSTIPRRGYSSKRWLLAPGRAARQWALSPCGSRGAPHQRPGGAPDAAGDNGTHSARTGVPGQPGSIAVCDQGPRCPGSETCPHTGTRIERVPGRFYPAVQGPRGAISISWVARRAPVLSGAW